MNILIYNDDDVVYGLDTHNILFDDAHNCFMVHPQHPDFINSSNARVEIVDDAIVKKYYYPGLCKYTTGGGFVIPSNLIDETITHHKSRLISELTEKITDLKYSNTFFENTDICNTSCNFGLFLNKNLDEAKNFLNNSFNYKTDSDEDNFITYSSNDIIVTTKVVNDHYQACDNLQTSIMNQINSFTLLTDFDSFDLDSYFPSSSQKLELDGTLTDILVNKYSLDCVLDKSIIDADGVDTATVNVTLLYDGNPTNLGDDIWYIPILNIDGNQEELIEFNLINGHGTIEWKTTNRGIYTIRMDLIRPVPKADLGDNLEVIAK